MKQIKDLRKFIASTVYEYLNEENQYSKLVFVEKQSIDKIRKVNDEINRLLNNHVFYNKNIYLKGGVARTALEIYLFGYNTDIIRDVDYCFIGNHSDFHGLNVDDDIEHKNTLDEYFKSRDVTINEVLLRPDALIFTRRAYRDFKKYKINPKTLFIDSRLYSRMLLFSIRYNYEIIDNLDVENIEIYDFDFLICLLKAYELKLEYEYYNICKENNITNAYSLSEWLINLLSNVVNFDLYGREKYIAKEILQYNSFEISKLYKMYPELQKEVEKIKFDDTDFSQYMKKRNRMKINDVIKEEIIISMKKDLNEDLNDNIITIYHGTKPKFVNNIKKDGLIDKTGYNQGWYMVSTDFESALFHAHPDKNDDNVYVIEFEIPYNKNDRWDGYPYLWKGQKMNDNSTWFALMKQIPKEYIKKIHKINYDDWFKQKELGF